MSPSQDPPEPPRGPAAEIAWGADGAPRSARFGDVYFDAADGLAESRAVFLEGCGLPEAFAGRDRFQVAELGFGLGLNILALWALWAATPDAPTALHVTSFEIAPPAEADIARAAARWPEIAPLAEHLTSSGWPPPAGFSTRRLVDGPATLDLTLGVGDANALLPAWSGAADAWFLDGFAPAKNPKMWAPALLAAVFARTAPGGRFATFTAAGWVRRALEEAGFAVDKRPGYGRKRERLGGRRPSSA